VLVFGRPLPFFRHECNSWVVCGVCCRAVAPFILLNIMRRSSPAFSRKKKDSTCLAQVWYAVFLYIKQCVSDLR